MLEPCLRSDATGAGSDMQKRTHRGSVVECVCCYLFTGISRNCYNRGVCGARVCTRGLLQSSLRTRKVAYTSGASFRAYVQVN